MKLRDLVLAKIQAKMKTQRNNRILKYTFLSLGIGSFMLFVILNYNKGDKSIWEFAFSIITALFGLIQQFRFKETDSEISQLRYSLDKVDNFEYLEGYEKILVEKVLQNLVSTS